MSWEIQGTVAASADIDALVADPTLPPAAHEAGQVAAAVAAAKQIVDAATVGGPVHVVIAGHGNASGGPEDGEPNEMVTLTVRFVAPTPSDATVVAERPTWGDATSTVASEEV